MVGSAESEQALSHPQANPEYRAAMLSCLIHLVGDEHQSMHCEYFYTDALTNGDRGGNDVCVKPDGRLQRPVRLRAQAWADFLGTIFS